MIVVDIFLAKFIRNGKSQTCLQHANSSTQSCSIVTSTSFPVEESPTYVNPTQVLLNATEVFTVSFDDITEIK